MLNVFVKKSAEKLYIQLSDSRMMPLEDLVRDYERLLNEESLKKVATSEPKADSQAVSKLKVGEWFRIDRNIIDENKVEIYSKCIEEGPVGKKLWKRFEAANKIANENPDQYPRLIETYIFEHRWNYKTEQEMWDMCERVGEGMCDEVICDLELQMRICNGESVSDLVKKYDKLPYVRVLKLRNRGTGYFGGGTVYNYSFPPADLLRSGFNPIRKEYHHTPYAFRRVL